MDFAEETRSTDKLKVKEGDDGQFYLSRTARNNKVRWTSEGYTREQDAWRAAWSSAPDIAAEHAPHGSHPSTDDHPVPATSTSATSTSATSPANIHLAPSTSRSEQTVGGNAHEHRSTTATDSRSDQDEGGEPGTPPDEVESAALRDRITAAADIGDVGHSNLPEPDLEEGGNPFSPAEAAEPDDGHTS